jgi:hypothetical protein
VDPDGRPSAKQLLTLVEAAMKHPEAFVVSQSDVDPAHPFAPTAGDYPDFDPNKISSENNSSAVTQKASGYDSLF